MRSHHDSPDDSVDAVLAAGPVCSTDDLRDDLLARTIGVLRRRRRRKRYALAASLLGCYLAGITTVAIGWLIGKEDRPVSPAQTAIREPFRTRGDSLLQSGPTSPEGCQAASANVSAYERWRRAGDYHLREAGDISRAVRDYARALDSASDEERAVSPAQDDWLLMALKDARAKEREHVRPQQN